MGSLVTCRFPPWRGGRARLRKARRGGGAADGAERARGKLAGSSTDGDRKKVKTAYMLTDGLAAVDAAGVSPGMLFEGVHSADVINILARQRASWTSGDNSRRLDVLRGGLPRTGSPGLRPNQLRSA